jgi:hypothetical protein
MEASSRPSSAVNKLRDSTANVPAEFRRHALEGHIPPGKVEFWMTPNWKLLPFVSSTFTDTKVERDFLMDSLQFEPRKKAHTNGVQVIFVDMRWGVRDENSCDHKTWVECSDMLQWCKEESVGVAFLSLQSDKYGYTTLPRTVSQEILVNHLKIKECSEETRQLVFQWYILDKNSQPGEYVLRKLKDKDEPEFWAA